MSISQLKKRGLVAEDPNRFLLLTEAGQDMAMHVEHNFRILSKFFEEVLGVDEDTARGDACKMEHLMSLETGRRLVWLMRYILSDEKRAAKVHEAMRMRKPQCESLEECPVCREMDSCMVASPGLCNSILRKSPKTTPQG
jgi:Mn-dependent DtxR family transcriptional regulator